MARIIVSEAAQFGIQGTTKSIPVKSDEYKKLINDADKKIEENQEKINLLKIEQNLKEENQEKAGARTMRPSKMPMGPVEAGQKWA